VTLLHSTRTPQGDALGVGYITKSICTQKGVFFIELSMLFYVGSLIGTGFRWKKIDLFIENTYNENRIFIDYKQ
jgi:hypothetical protein